jgi:excisionase family DNA binding protein
MIVIMEDAMKKLFTVRETCAYLRISPPTLYRMLVRDELIPVKIGKHTLFDKKDLDTFIEGSKKTPKKSTARSTRKPAQKKTSKQKPPKKEPPKKKAPKTGEQGELL